MTALELAVGFAMMTAGALIARRFKTREKAAAAFDRMKLDWVSGVGLAFVIVLAWLCAATLIIPHVLVKK